MQNEYTFDIDGTVILLRALDYTEKVYDKRIIALHALTTPLDPVRYQAFRQSRKGKGEAMLGTATQYARGAEWHIHGSIAVRYLGAAPVVPDLKAVAAVFKQDADALIDSIDVEVRMHDDEDEG